jgi:hypothetical protein
MKDAERTVEIDYGQQATISLYVESSRIFDILMRNGAPPEAACEATNAIIAYLTDCAKAARPQ